MIDLYTDGSAYLADQSGGWGWWINDGCFDSGSALGATNQTMEMMAVIEGLEFAALWLPGDIRVVSDSAYVINCHLEKWYVAWRRRMVDMTWRTAAGKRVANQELWERMLLVVEGYPGQITWHHCRGHGRGGPEDAPFVFGNDRVDRLAGAARKAGIAERALG